MPSECCDEYKLIQLYQKSSVWCFAFSHTFTFELIPQSRDRPVGSLGDMTQHQSKCLIFANQQLKVSNIFLCSCCFRPTATWLSYRCWPTLINPFRPTDCFHWAKLPTLFRKFCNNCSVFKTKFPQCLDPSFIFVRYFTHNQSLPITYMPSCDYDLKYWRIYRLLQCNVARKHKK